MALLIVVILAGFLHVAESPVCLPDFTVFVDARCEALYYARPGARE